MRPVVTALLALVALAGAGRAAHADALVATGWSTGLTIPQCNALAVSRDGATLVALNNGELATFDAATGLLRKRIAFASAAGAMALDLSPDGATIAAGVGEAVVFYDTATLAESRRIGLGKPGSGASVQAIRFSPDGALLAVSAGGEGGDFRTNGDNIFAVATGKRVTQLARGRNEQRLTSDFAWSPDGKWLALAVSNQQKGLELYETKTWTKKAKAPYKKDATRVVFVADGSQVIVGSIDRTLRVHMVIEKAVALAKQWVAHEGTASDDRGYIAGLAALADGSVISASDDDAGLRWWDRKHGTERARAHHDVGRLAALAVAPDGKTLWVGGVSTKKIQRFALETSADRTTTP